MQIITGEHIMALVPPFRWWLVGCSVSGADSGDFGIRDWDLDGMHAHFVCEHLVLSLKYFWFCSHFDAVLITICFALFGSFIFVFFFCFNFIFCHASAHILFHFPTPFCVRQLFGAFLF